MDRKNQFKNQDLEGGRRRREETSLLLRKAKKEEQLSKRRQANPTALANTANNNIEIGHVHDAIGGSTPTVGDIPFLMEGLKSNAPEGVLKAVRGFRKMLSVAVNPPVDEIIEARALPLLVENLLNYNHHDIMFEAAWAVTNIASTERTKDVFEAGATTMLLQLLLHEKPTIREQAAWCLGNIAGDCPEYRDHLLQNNVLNGLIQNMRDPGSQSLLGNVVWTVSNLCRGKPLPKIEHIKPAIGPIAALLDRNVDNEVLVDVIWAFSYLSDGDDEKIKLVMDTGAAPKLVNLLTKNDRVLLVPLVRTLGNLVTGNDEQTQAVVDAGVITAMNTLLENSNKNTRKEVCWTLSNIAAGTQEQIQALFEEEELLEKLVHVACNDRWEVKKEAIWTLCNICTTGHDYHIRSLIQRGGLSPLSESLTSKDTKVIKIVLEATEKILELSEKLNLNYVTMFDEIGGIDHLEELQSHSDEDIYELSVNMLERFFGVEEDEDENVAPAQEDGQYSFGFGIQSKQLFPSESTGEHHQPVVFASSTNFPLGDANMQV